MIDLQPTPQMAIDNLRRTCARNLTLRLCVNLDGPPLEPLTGYQPFALTNWNVDESTLTATIENIAIRFSASTVNPIVGVYITDGDGPPLYAPSALPGGPYRISAGGELFIPRITIRV